MVALTKEAIEQMTLEGARAALEEKKGEKSELYIQIILLQDRIATLTGGKDCPRPKCGGKETVHYREDGSWYCGKCGWSSGVRT